MKLKFKSSQFQDIWFTSDTHFGHANILKFQPNRNFATIKDMDNYLINEWNQKVKPNDIVIHIGDVSWYKPSETGEILQRLPGLKFLVKGNHDRPEFGDYFINWSEYAEITIDNQHIVAMHYPILEWNRSHHGSFHVHGHVHGRNLQHEIGCSLGRIMDVGIDANPNVTLFNYKDIRSKLEAIDYRNGFRLGAGY